MTNVENMFYRVNADGNAEILDFIDGSWITRIDASVYPIGSSLSARYEHPEGIVLTIADAELIGIRPE